MNARQSFVLLVAVLGVVGLGRVARAAIVYSGPDRNITCDRFSCPRIDLFDAAGGWDDLKLLLDVFEFSGETTIFLGSQDPGHGNRVEFNRIGPGFRDIERHPAGRTIDASEDWSQFHRGDISYYIYECPPDCYAISGGEYQNKTGYAGIRLTRGADVHYGWIQLQVSDFDNANIQALIIDWAYEAEPGQLISTGQTSGGFGVVRPDEIPGSVVWLDAADPASITVSGDAVTAWADKSEGGGGGVAASITSEAPRTGLESTNGLNVLSFDGIDDFLEGSPVLAAGDDSFSFFAVWRPNQVKRQVVLEQNSSTVQAGRRASLRGNENAEVGFNGHANNALIANYAAGAFMLSGFVVDPVAEQVTVYQDDTVQTGTIDFALQDVAVDHVMVGARGSTITPSELLDGTIAEIVVFDRALTDGLVRPDLDEVNDVMLYLDEKWGLGLGLTPTPQLVVLPALSLPAAGLLGLALLLSGSLAGRARCAGTERLDEW
jgi:hypothetical protein